MIIRKAMYGCGLYFFIKLAYNSPILCKFAHYLFIFDIKGLKIVTWIVNIRCSTPCRAVHNHTLNRMCVTAWLATLQFMRFYII